MQNITLGDIATAAAFIAALGGSVWTILSGINKALKKALEPVLKRLDDERMDRCKDFLVQILSYAERGDRLTEMEKIRFAENYTYYRNHDGNSYIKEWYEKLHEEGKI